MTTEQDFRQRIARWLADSGFPHEGSTYLGPTPAVLLFPLAKAYYNYYTDGSKRLDDYIVELARDYEWSDPEDLYLFSDSDSEEYEIVNIRRTDIMGVVRDSNGVYSLVGIETTDDEYDIVVPDRELVLIDNLIIRRAFNE